MKITVTGPTGNVGGHLTEKLLGSGAKLTLIARSPGKVKRFADRGARVVQGSLDDVSVVEQATEGADALFWLTPPTTTAENVRAYQGVFGDIVAEAARSRPGLHVVHLSSAGAHLAEGTGPVKGLHDIEQKLNGATTAVTHLRPTYFMENALFNLGTITANSAIFSHVPADVRLQQVATRDIAAVAAEVLLAPAPSSPRVIHILGPEETTLGDNARAISGAIGKQVDFVVLPKDRLIQAMLSMGISPDVASQLLELQEANAQGLIAPPAGSTVRTGTTTFAQFLQEVFVLAYRQAAGAASA